MTTLDQLLRYQPVLAQLRTEPAGGVLDVGSGPSGLAPFLAGVRDLTQVDPGFAGDDSSGDGVRRVSASVLDLPFAEREFSVVVALDLLEHLSPAERPRAMSELARVCSRLLVVGCPAGRVAAGSDRLLAAYIALWRRTPPDWLAEHLAQPVPTSADLERPHGFALVARMRNENAAARLALLLAAATPVVARGLDRGGRRWAERLDPGAQSRRLALLRLFDLPPAYRVVAAYRRRPA